MVAGTSKPENEKMDNINKTEKTDTAEKANTSSNSKFFERPHGNLEKFEMKGKIGIGFDITAIYFGLGPAAEYWFTDNIDLHALYSVPGTIRLLGCVVNISSTNHSISGNALKMKPYIGIGYSSKKSDESIQGYKFDTKGVWFRLTRRNTDICTIYSQESHVADGFFLLAHKL